MLDIIYYIIAGVVGLGLGIWLGRLMSKAKGGEDRDKLIELHTLTKRQADELAGFRQEQTTLQSTLFKVLGDQYTMVLKELGESRQSLTSSLGGQGKELEIFFGKVQSQLTTVTQSAQELNRQATAIAELRDLLRAPVQRGITGEFILEKVLQDNLPRESYSLQYQLPSGRVDAIVHLGDRMVPIDSKFPLPAYERLRKANDAEENVKKKARRDFVKAVKDRIDEAAKYVRSDAGTVDFGLVFLPAEGIYAEAAQRRYPDDPDDDLLAYANRQKMALVSPSLLFAYLRTVYLGLQSLRIGERAEEIIIGLTEIKTAFHGVRVPLEKLGRQLDFARSNYEETSKMFDRADLRLGQLTAEGVGPELLSGEEPPVLPSDENGF